MSPGRFAPQRRWQLAACVVAMLAIASPQYTWTLFSTPLATSLDARLSEVQVAFTLFVLAQSWLVPVLGYAVDLLGARLVVSAGGMLVGFSWIASGLARSLPDLYLAYALGGVGVGAVYGAALGTILKWFPDRRGLAAGLAVGGYGSGAALAVVPIQRVIANQGYRTAFVGFGLLQGLVILAAAWVIAAPYPGWRPGGGGAPRAGALEEPSHIGYRPSAMVTTSPFWIMYLISVLVMFGGLLVTAQLKPMAAAHGLDHVAVLGGVNLLGMALMANLIVSALARPLWGWLSDRLGRYSTMAIAFAMGGVCTLGLLEGLDRPLWFVAFSSLTVFAWGSAFVLFSASIADVFGSDYAATNIGIQYTSKGAAAIFAGWGAARVLEATDSWAPVLWLAAACNLLAAALVLLALRPAVERFSGRRAPILLSAAPAGPAAGQRE